MSAVASLEVLTATNAVSVPAAAVFRDGNHDAVWLVRGGKASKQAVVLGAQGDAAIQVLLGVASAIAIESSRARDKVTEGQRVEAGRLTRPWRSRRSITRISQVSKGSRVGSLARREHPDRRR